MPQRKPSLRGVEERNALVLQFLPLVASIYRRLSHSNAEVRRLGYDEAVQAGALYLLRAAELFDESLGFKPITYFTWVVRDGILKAAQNNFVIRQPKEHRADADLLKYTADIDEIPLELQPADESDVFAEAEAREQKEWLRAAVRRLPNRQRRVISLYFKKGWNLQEIGDEFGGLSKERIRQIRDKALQKLRRLLRSTV